MYPVLEVYGPVKLVLDRASWLQVSIVDEVQL
jgi:hypothetical protein